MDLYCVIGNPVEHSKSPWIHSRFAALMGQSLDYQKLLVSLGEFSQAVDNFRSRGGRGCNITLPFKQEAAALATQRSARVELAQACNTLIFQGDQIVGENTDGLGLVSDIVGNAQTQISKRDVLVIGAGGAAAGILGPLLEQRPKCLWVANRTAHKAAGLVARHASLAHSLGVDCQAFGLSDAEKKNIQVLKKDFNKLGYTYQYARLFINRFAVAYKNRAMQASKIKELIAASPHPTVVCGDFNDLPGSFVYKALKGNMLDAFVEKGSGFGRTYNLFSPTLRIDYIFYDHRIGEIQSFDCPKMAAYSDHNPVMATFKLVAQSQ